MADEVLTPRQKAQEFCDQVFGNVDLPGICMAVRMGLTGSSDWPDFPIGENENPDRSCLTHWIPCRDALQARLDAWDWNQGLKSTANRDFDNAVRFMVRATVEMLNEDIRKEQERGT